MTIRPTFNRTRVELKQSFDIALKRNLKLLLIEPGWN